MIETDKILLKQLVTEKATMATSLKNQYTFKVAGDTNRIAVKQAVEKQFGVHVTSVNILNVKPKFKRDRYRRGQLGRKPGYKKAIVRLQEGESIDLV